MIRAGTSRNATESIYIKRVSLPCWLLGVTEARILLGTETCRLAASFFLSA